MELNTFLNLKDDLRIYYTKIGFKFKIIEKKIYLLQNNNITLSFFYNPQKKAIKIYYISSFYYNIYRIRSYRTDNEDRIFREVKKYIKKIEEREYGLY